MGYHVCREHDHLARIAHRHGVAPGDIWDHDKNASLKRARGDGSVLRAGDLIFVPDAPARQRITMQAGSTQTFRGSVARVPLRLRLSAGGRAIAGEPFHLETPGEAITGTTDGDGVVDVQVRVFTGRATLYLDRRRERYLVDLGGLDPAGEVTGVQQRLRHLGYYAGEAHGALDDATRDALRRFQAARGLADSGEPDAATATELVTAHGC